MTYLWLKLLHIFFVIAWFAGLFYLPRIFVNLAMVPPGSPEYLRLLVMARKLYRFMTPLGIFALAFGFVAATYMGYWSGQGWAHAKLLTGIVLAGYHFFCSRLLHGFAAGSNRMSHRQLRFFNEIPVLLMFAALVLVIFRPF